MHFGTKETGVMPYEEIAFYSRPTDPAAFDAHYRTVHAPLAATLPGLISFSTLHPEHAESAGLPDVYMIARVTFASKEAALDAMHSAVAAELEADMANFAGAGVRTLLGSAELFI
jgi:uncharacterized protein (TIGR02118 family)